MPLHVLMVAKNEADRYLASALKWASSYADNVYVYDDQSDDGTPEIAAEYAKVKIRPDSTPSFLQHEGKFRQAALDSMVSELGVKDGDWVHVLDADEFLVAETDVRAQIDACIAKAESLKAKSIRVLIPTVWGGYVAKGRILVDPLVRIDRFWNILAEPRIWQYQEGAQFLDKAMACRNEPTYVRRHPMYDGRTHLINFHYGYAFPEDRVERYNRYISLEDHGHHPDFIESIRQLAPTRRWEGPWIPVKRGR